MSSPLLLLSLAFLLVSSSGCSEDADTHLVVVMDTDYDVPTEVDRIRARVLKVSEDGTDEVETWNQEFPVTAGNTSETGMFALPASFSVVPEGADIDREVVVELDAAIEDLVLVTRRARTSFVPGEFRVLRMFLYRACAEADCVEGTSCGCTNGAACANPSCVDELVDPLALEPTNDPGALPPSSNIPIECGSGQALCGSECVDLQTDARFCGECLNACNTGDACVSGRCVDPDDCRTNPSRCTGFTYCEESAGECLRGCAFNDQCGRDEQCDTTSHECVCDGDLVRCPSDFGECVDITMDLAFCGDCDTTCPSNNVCSAGVCVDLGDCRTNGVGCTGFSYCNESTGNCIRGCVLDEQCGAPNQVCDIELNDCVCDDGFRRCPPVVGDCVDTQTDLTYCGDCDTSCSSVEVCEGGICLDPDDCRTNEIGCSGFTYCDDSTGNCLAGCDREAQCPGANDRCDLESHTCECNEGLLRCGIECVDVQEDARYCGDCANACEPGETCEQGACLDPDDCRANGIGCSGFTYCDDSSGACLPGCTVDEQCPEDQKCDAEAHECFCTSGETPCDDKCVNTRFDDQNCGRCGRSCDEGVCFLGQCFGSDDD